jgi:sugar lactone lactonase YvrE
MLIEFTKQNKTIPPFMANRKIGACPKSQYFRPRNDHKTIAILLPVVACLLFAACKKNASIQLSPSTNNLTMAALTNSKDTFSIISTTSWTASCNEPWVSLSQTSGTGNATIVLTGQANTGNTSSRSAAISLMASGTNYGVVNIVQDAGVIVVAGTGTVGAALNQLSRPYGICMDKSQNLYVADLDNNRVVKWAAGASQGTIVAGDGTSGAGLNQVSAPTSVFVDASGNLYISEVDNNRVTKWTPGASQGVLVAGSGTAGVGLNSLDVPMAIWVDPNANLYIADQNNYRAVEWTSGASVGIQIAGTGAFGSSLSQVLPGGIFVDSAGNAYIGDAGNARVVKWAPGAIQGIMVAGTGVAGTGLDQFSNPHGVFIDQPGDIYVADYANGRVMKWSPGAQQGAIVAGAADGSQGVALGQLASPISIWVDPAGYIYVAEQGSARVTRWAQ